MAFGVKLTNIYNEVSRSNLVHADGNPVIVGSWEMFPKKFYKSESLLDVRQVTRQDGTPTTVTNMTCGHKLNEYEAKMMLDMFSIQASAGQYLQVDFAFWGGLGERLQNTNPQDGDIYVPMFKAIKPVVFDKKDSTKGVKLVATCYDFEIKRRKSDTSKGPTVAAPAQAQAPIPQATAQGTQTAAPTPIPQQHPGMAYAQQNGQGPAQPVESPQAPAQQVAPVSSQEMQAVGETVDLPWQQNVG